MQKHHRRLDKIEADATGARADFSGLSDAELAAIAFPDGPGDPYATWGDVPPDELWPRIRERLPADLLALSDADLLAIASA
jgi:hypothetical protein